MTEKQIKRECEMLTPSDERIIEINEESGIVDVVSISRANIVWRRWYYIDNKELHFIKCQFM